MRAPRHPRSLLHRRTLPASEAGVGLVELMVVVVILSMLMMVAVPSYQQIQRKSRAAALVNDFRVFSTAFQAYAHETGNWPPETAAGVIPPGFTADDFNLTAWTRGTEAIGGKFDWEFNQLHGGVRYRAALALSDTADHPLLLDPALFLEMDRLLDDGDFSTGSFRLGDNLAPLVILEP